MKSYTVLVTPEAEAGIVSAFHYIQQRALASAAKWLSGLYKKINTLERMPRRCASARESLYFGENLRQLAYKSHRAVFRIEETNSIVRVLHFLHAKQQAAGEPGVGTTEDE